MEQLVGALHRNILQLRWQIRSILQKIPFPNSGPCVIVRANLLTFSTPPFSGAWIESSILSGGEEEYLKLLEKRSKPACKLAAVGHQNFVRFASHEGWTLEPLPFPGNIVINHWDLTSHVSGGAGSYHCDRGLPSSAFRKACGKLKRRVKMLPSLRPITRTLRTEFAISDDEEIPARFRHGGSIFWR